MTTILIESWMRDGTNEADYVGQPDHWNSIGTSQIIATAPLPPDATQYWTGTSASTNASKLLTSTQEDDVLFVGVVFAGDLSSAFDIIVFRSDNDATPVTHVTIRVQTTGAISAYRGTPTTNLLGSTPIGVVSPNQWCVIEVMAKLGDTTTGQVIIKVNGNQELDTGGVDTKNAGTKTKFDEVRIQVTNSATRARYSGIYIFNEQGSAPQNTFIGPFRVPNLRPNGNGNSSQLTGSDGNSTDNYLLVDEAAHNDADYVGSATDNQKDTYTYGNLTAVTGSVAALCVNSRALASDAGAKSFAAVLRMSATEADSADQALTASAVGYGHLYETKPGGGAITASDVDAMEAGFKVRP